MNDTNASPDQEPQDGIVGYVTDLVERLGGPGAGLAVALENLFPPIPSEVILPLAGFVAAQGRMSLVGAIFWTTLWGPVGLFLATPLTVCLLVIGRYVPTLEF